MAINFSFQATNDFAEHTQSCANMIGLKNSDYVREAVREKNERVMADQFVMDQQLFAQSTKTESGIPTVRPEIVYATKLVSAIGDKSDGN